MSEPIPTKKDMTDLLLHLDSVLTTAMKSKGCEYVLITMAPRPADPGRPGVTYATSVSSSMTDLKEIMVALVHAAVEVKEAIEAGISAEVYERKKG